MAGDATVEESAMLKERGSGEEREVDVVIRSAAAGYPLVVSIEAVATRRKADKPWGRGERGVRVVMRGQAAAGDTYGISLTSSQVS
jgi:hypothetical protein